MADVTKNRGNNFYYDASLNTIGTLRKTKPAGYRNVLVRVRCLPIGTISAGQAIRLECVIGGSALNGSPSKPFYRQARLLLPGDSDARFYVFNYKFPGWAEEEMVMDIYLERRSDTSVGGTPSALGLFVDRVSMICY